jgi:hypothetical protein
MKLVAIASFAIITSLVVAFPGQHSSDLPQDCRTLRKTSPNKQSSKSTTSPNSLNSASLSNSTNFKYFTKEEYEAMFQAVVFGAPQHAQKDAEKYFSPDYVQITDGHKSNFTQFVDHISTLRGVIVSGNITVSSLVQNGRQIADRHIVNATKADGNVIVSEVILIGERDEEGLMYRVWELTRLIEGSEDDANLGSIS